MLYAFVAIAGLLSFFALYSKNALMGVVGAGGWLAVTYWFNTNLPTNGIAIGTPLFDTIIVACVGASIATLVIPIMQDNESDNGFIGRVKRVINHGNFSDNTPKRRSFYDASPEEYNEILRGALRRNGARRRR